MSKSAEGEGEARPASTDEKQAAVLFAGFVVALLTICWFVLDPLKYGILAGLQAGQPVRAAALAAIPPLIPRLTLLGLAAGALFVLLACLEFRARSLSALLARGGTWPFALVGLSLLLWFTQAYLYPGHFLGGDTGSHVMRVAHFGRGLVDGKNLFWSNYFYLGAPLLQFYAPLFFWLGGGIFAITGDIALSIKLLLLFLHLLSGILFYGFMRTVGLQRFSALIGAISFAGAWAHTNLILYKGALPLTVIIALCPAAFLLAERLMRKDSVAFGWDWAGLALVSGAMIAAHQPHGMFVGIYLAIYVLARLWLERRVAARLPSLGSAGLAGVLISLFTVLPFMAEKHWVVGSAAAAQLLSLRLPSLETLHHLLTWSNAATSMGSASAGYLGLSVVALGACVLLFLIRKASIPKEQKAWGLLMLALLTLSLFLKGPMLRDVIYTLFFISALAALGCEWLIARHPERPRLALVLLALVLLDLGATAVQPIARTDKYFLDEAGKHLAAEAPNERVVLGNTRPSKGDARIVLDIGPSGSPFNYYAVQTISGPHNHAATLAHNYAVSSLMWAERDLRESGKLSQDSATLLAILNVSRIVSDNSRSMGLPPTVTNAIDEGPVLGRTLRVVHPTPVLFARDLGLLPEQSDLERPMLWREDFLPEPTPQVTAIQHFLQTFLATLEPRLPQREASRIPVRSLPDNYIGPNPGATAEETSQRAVKLIDYQVAADSTKLNVKVEAAGYLQISHPWYPTIAVFDNNERVSTSRSAIGLIVVAVKPGIHDFRILPERSSLRWNLGALSLASLALTLAVPMVNRKRA